MSERIFTKEELSYVEKMTKDELVTICAFLNAFKIPKFVPLYVKMEGLLINKIAEEHERPPLAPSTDHPVRIISEDATSMKDVKEII